MANVSQAGSRRLGCFHQILPLATYLIGGLGTLAPQSAHGVPRLGVSPSIQPGLIR